MALSPAREHEIKKARSLSLPKGSIVVEDLGYTDYAWYTQLTAQKIFFVTPQKRNARYAVLEHRQVKKNQGGGIFTKSLNLDLSVFISLLNSWNFFYGSNCWNLISVLPSGTGAGTIAGPRKQRL